MISDRGGSGSWRETMTIGRNFAAQPRSANHAKLADAEPGVEQGPDDEPFGGRLAGVGQTISIFGGERFSHVLIRHLSPSKSCVL